MQWCWYGMMVAVVGWLVCWWQWWSDWYAWCGIVPGNGTTNYQHNIHIQIQRLLNLGNCWTINLLDFVVFSLLRLGVSWVIGPSKTQELMILMVFNVVSTLTASQVTCNLIFISGYLIFISWSCEGQHLVIFTDMSWKRLQFTLMHLVLMEACF